MSMATDPGAALDAFLINQALTRYTMALDSCALDVVEDCFIPDAVLDYDELGVMSPKAFVERSAAIRGLDGTHHALGLPLMGIRGDAASSRCYFVAQHVKNALAPGAFLSTGGWYDDELIRTAAGWKIARRRAVRVWVNGNPAVVGLPGVRTAEGMLPSGASPRSASGRDAPQWLKRLPAANGGGTGRIVEASLELDAFLISQLLSRYAVAVDSGAFELLADCVTDDALIDYGGGVEMNREQFIRSFEPVLELEATHHLLGLPALSIEGDVARSRCYCIAQHVKNGEAAEPCLTMGGYHQDELRRTEAGWRIHRRQAVRTWMAGNPAVLGISDAREAAGPPPEGGLQKGAENVERTPPPWFKATTKA